MRQAFKFHDPPSRSAPPQAEREREPERERESFTRNYGP
jgi:hypothetical protein